MIGYAYGDSTSEDKFSQFNVAVVGALSKDTPFMTKELVKRIKMDRRININEDWKVMVKYTFSWLNEFWFYMIIINNNHDYYIFKQLITIMTSANTYCIELCYDDHTVYAERRREEIMKSFLYIKENLPRTIINFIISASKWKLSINI